MVDADVSMLTNVVELRDFFVTIFYRRKFSGLSPIGEGFSGLSPIGESFEF